MRDYFLQGILILRLRAALARRFSKRLKTIVVTHGIEVWTELSPQRRSALLKSRRDPRA